MGSGEGQRRCGIEMLELNHFYNMDCMDGMAQIPDKYFELAIVDPPYGIGDKFKGGKNGKMQFNEIVNKEWDKAPNQEYFNELFRVSKNQIIWGGNYFQLPPTRCFVVWDKIISEDFSLAMAELAWTSFDALAKIIKMFVPKDGLKIHPTQKPVKLYEWLLVNYAKKGDKILDTHVGSASSLIACHNLGFEYMGFEKDEDYHKAATERLEAVKAQMRLY
jgi:site-specific DNA-methyltransferase (adenine-specific)